MNGTRLNNNGTGTDTGMLNVRVFIASPGDVTDERGLARAVIEQIRGERAFRGRIDLQGIAWDQAGMGVAMEAALTPQEAIKRGLPKPSECDIVIVILWSRIGTPLPAEYQKADGAGYLSGTEWEFFDAIDGFRKSRRPSVWLYRRSQEPSIGLNDPDFDEKRSQWNRVHDFFTSLVHDDRSIAGGVNTYETPSDFRRLLEGHLRDRLTLLLHESGNFVNSAESEPGETAPEAPLWPGVPYPGLPAFSREQAPIFFGRGRETDQLIQLFANPHVRFAAVVGASGSGKSSLVAAGLVPRLLAGALEGSEQWRVLSFKPGERGGDPFLALAYPLKEALGTTGQREKDLADELHAEPGVLAAYIDTLLAGRLPRAAVLLVVDQFEELFTQVKPDDCKKFIALIREAVKIQHLRLVATMRVDFYPRAVECGELDELLRGSGTFPLSAPGVGALHEMITGPAQMSGLDIPPVLINKILDETGTGPGALSLMAFTLHELYERGKTRNDLSLDDYKTIGGVKGAICKRAEDTLKRLGSEAGLDTVFEQLTEVDEHEVATRRRALQEHFKPGSSERLLVDALIDARLLVAGKGEDDKPTVEVAHEALLSSWTRLQKWIEEHATELRTKRNLEHAAVEWDEAKRPRWSGLASGHILKGYRSVPSPSELARKYLYASRRLKWLRGSIAAFAVLSVLLVTSFIGWITTENMNARVALWLLLARSHFYTLQPEMITLRPGTGIYPESYTMGSSEDDTGKPPHDVTMARPFAIGRYEVTFDEYEVFVRAYHYKYGVPSNEGWGGGDRPVINVSWKHALAYAEWLSEQTGKRYRLPTEAEWEYAARAGSTTRYWWGDEMKPGMANCDDCGGDWKGKAEGKGTAPVGSFKPNAFGLYDTAGNVWERVQDCWHDNYDGAPDDGSAWLEGGGGDCGQRVLRGGSWLSAAVDLRSANRDWNTADSRHNNWGFRLAQDIK